MFDFGKINLQVLRVDQWYEMGSNHNIIIPSSNIIKYSGPPLPKELPSADDPI